MKPNAAWFLFVSQALNRGTVAASFFQDAFSIYKHSCTIVSASVIVTLAANGTMIIIVMMIAATTPAVTVIFMLPFQPAQCTACRNQ